MGGSRKRHHPSEDEQEEHDDDEHLSDHEEGELSDESGNESSHKRHSKSSHKKSKKHKKDKKKKKKHKRHSSDDEPVSSRRGEEVDDDSASTDRGGGSTPDKGPIILDAVSDEESFANIEKPGQHRHRERHRRHKERSVSAEDKRKSRQRSQDRGNGDGNERRGRDRSNDRRRHRPTMAQSPIGSDEEEAVIKDGHSRRHVDGQRRDDRPPKEEKRRRRSPSETRLGDLTNEPPEEFGNQKSSGGAVISMSIAETNRLRAQLGLKPLNVGSSAPKQDETEAREDDGLEGTLIPNSDVRHKPAINLAEKSHYEKLREKLAQRRTKRHQEAKLISVKTLGESDSDEDSAAAWVKRQKKKEKEKAEAEKRAKMLADLDDEFGIGSIVEEETKREKQKSYAGENLSGLRVEHSAERFKTGESVILTLKDADILDETAGDHLVNVNMIDEERVERNLKNLRDAKAGGYNPYDEEIDPLTGDLTKKGLLSKYDEEISGKESKKSFELGSGGLYNEDEAMRMERERIRVKLNKRIVESLDTPAPRIASDFLTEEESAVKFKKIKKKKKVKRKMLKADDLLPLDEDDGPAKASTSSVVPMDLDLDDVGQVVDMTHVRVDDEDDVGLQRALARTRMLKQRAREDDAAAKNVAAIASSLPRSVREDDDDDEKVTTGAEFIGTFADDVSTNKNIILNETSEFCRHLGAWRANDSSGLGESVSKDLLEFESSLKSDSHHHKQQRRGQWEEVGRDADMRDFDSDDSDNDDRRDKASTTILDEEPDLARGVAGAIKMAATKGYFESKEKEIKGSNLAHLMAKSYTIDDKIKDDDRNTRRERYGGPTTTFSEKANYTPNVQLDYVDEHGRKMNQKEAFRYLSHRFHGKGSGKMKTEKRMKKVMEEAMMRSMSSTDTPLQTLEKLRERQKEAATPYLVLTGNKINPTDLRK